MRERVSHVEVEILKAQDARLNLNRENFELDGAMLLLSHGKFLTAPIRAFSCKFNIKRPLLL